MKKMATLAMLLSIGGRKLPTIGTSSGTSQFLAGPAAVVDRGRDTL
jgi:hypothetical protein